MAGRFTGADTAVDVAQALLCFVFTGSGDAAIYPAAGPNLFCGFIVAGIMGAGGDVAIVVAGEPNNPFVATFEEASARRDDCASLHIHGLCNGRAAYLRFIYVKSAGLDYALGQEQVGPVQLAASGAGVCGDGAGDYCTDGSGVCVQRRRVAAANGGGAQVGVFPA